MIDFLDKIHLVKRMQTDNMSNQQASTIYQENSNAQALFHDPNPQIMRRPATDPPRTYTQRVFVRFLQPPPVPPPGVCHISRERRKKTFFFIAFSL